MGQISLAPHQAEALVRIRAAMEEFGGALLCDAVGVGKTFVAAAVAAEFGGALIIAPAALRAMWTEASTRTGVTIRFLSMESLSRADASESPGGCLIVVDEAHHFRNSGTRRYRKFARLAAGRRVLLMTATPIHNREKDLANLFRLFLGRRTDHLGETEIARLVIRRDHGQITNSSRIPDVTPARWLEIPDRPEVAEAILSLPAPVPLRDAGEAAELVAHGLLRQWASSEAALKTAIRRRLAKARSLEASLESGAYPSAAELKSWLPGEDCIQLGFPDLLSPRLQGGCERFITSIRSHIDGLRAVLDLLGEYTDQDDARCMQIAAILDGHRTSHIVCFASFQATVEMFFRKLACRGGIAALTSGGGQIWTGKINRDEILNQFGPTMHQWRRASEIRLLLTTDLLSEGVNLQRADVVVHLDLPWTPARIEQRVGRLARIGSQHRRVNVYGLSPPASADRILRNIPLLESKRERVIRAVGSLPKLGFWPTTEPESQAIPSLMEQLRAVIGSWLRRTPRRNASRPLLGAAHAAQSSFLALIRSAGTHQLLCGDANRITSNLAAVLDCARCAGGAPREFPSQEGTKTLQRIGAWLALREGTAIAGMGDEKFLESRRRIFNRLNKILDASPPHTRHAMASRVDLARRAASQVQGAAIERALDELASDTNLTDDIFIQRLIETGTQSSIQSASADRDEILAVLLLSSATPPPSS